MKEKDLPTYLDLVYSESSKIFEAEEIQGLDPDQIQEAEKVYHNLVDKLEKGEEIDEGLFGGIIGGLAGPTVARAVCKVLGIDEHGTLGKLMTSRLVTVALGLAM